MNGFDRQQFLDDFIRWLGQPFINIFPVSRERADAIADKYFRSVKAITDDLLKRASRGQSPGDPQGGLLKTAKKTAQSLPSSFVTPAKTPKKRPLGAA